MACNSQKKCGCSDTPFTTQYLCGTNTSNCPTPELCPETFSSDCAVYMGDTIVDLDIHKGDRFTQIIQKLALMVVNSTCGITSETCNAVTNLRTNGITTTSIALLWDIIGTPDSFVLEYKEVDAVSWSESASLPNTTTGLTLSGLTAGATYHIRVDSICGENDCYSLTIETQTNQ